MVFNSLFNLVLVDSDRVYNFFCDIFLENHIDLDIEDRLYLFVAIKNFKTTNEIDFPHFIKYFENRCVLKNILTKLAPGNEYNLFISRKNVDKADFNSTLLKLANSYIQIFGKENIRE